MRAHYLQHVPFEGLGTIESWLKAAGYEMTVTRFFESAVLPAIDDVDLLIIMGGPMSVKDEKDYSWLRDEKRFIKRAIEAGKSTLGICLGAQLIADVMGGQVLQNPVKEIGWFPIHGVEQDASSSAFQFPAQTDAFHWHGETFCLPPGAVQLARSGACENQAFQIGNNVIGLQFHLETTPDSAQAMVEHCRDELVNGEYIQTAAEILSAPPERYMAANRLMEHLLEYLM